MTDGRFVVALALASVLLGLTAAPVRGADITGTWIGKTEIPDQGTATVTLVLKSSGKGYTGSLSDSLDNVAKDVEIKNVKLDGDTLTFQFVLTDGTELMMRLKVSGDTMTGQWEHPEGSVGAITLARKK
jgi:hypothetical protein